MRIAAKGISDEPIAERGVASKPCPRMRVQRGTDGQLHSYAVNNSELVVWVLALPQIISFARLSWAAIAT